MKITNPFDPERNRCFGCGRANPAGLKLEFEDDGENLYTFWEPSYHFQGYPGILHGGIAATLLDETAAWFVYAKIGTAGVISGMNISYHKPVFLSRGKLKITAQLLKKEEKMTLIKCILTDNNNNICTEAKITYYLFPPETAKRKYHYPGQEAFYKSDSNL